MSIKEFLWSWGFIKDIKKPENSPPPLTTLEQLKQSQEKNLFNDVPKPSYVLMDLIIAEMLKLEFKVSFSCETDLKTSVRKEVSVIQLRPDLSFSLIKNVYEGYERNSTSHISIESANIPYLNPEERKYLQEGAEKAMKLQKEKQENDREATRQRQALAFIEKFTQPDMSDEDRELFVQVKSAICYELYQKERKG